MTSAKWLDIPTAILPIRELIATQPGVLLHAHYLEDGHHRVVRARLNGRRAIRARVLSLD
ncbi:MAG: hypothetical protein ACTHKE_04300 [Sphingomicrobium sp.]